MNVDKIGSGVLSNICRNRGFNLAPKHIPANMVATLGDDVQASSTVQKWAGEFKRGRESLEDDPRSERPATATTLE